MTSHTLWRKDMTGSLSRTGVDVATGEGGASAENLDTGKEVKLLQNKVQLNGPASCVRC